jgi:hypothetical protein
MRLRKIAELDSISAHNMMHAHSHILVATINAFRIFSPLEYEQLSPERDSRNLLKPICASIHISPSRKNSV